MTETATSLIQPPDGYGEWLAELKTRIQSAQQRAALAVNRELIELDWQIGRDILARQAAQGWGAKVIERLAQDLRNAFPEMKGFSRSNLLYMRAFAEAWPDEQIVQQAVGQLPWGHNLVLLGIAEYKLQEALPEELKINLPSIEKIERELQGGEQ
jgi:predicted nuclease of restriction endonuclease-like (RecB) superfamily